MTRTLTKAAEAPNVFTFDSTFPNPCNDNELDEDVSVTAYRLQPAEGPPVLIAVEWTFDDTSLLFGDSIFGTVTLFCEDGSVIVAAGKPSPADSSGKMVASVVFQTICTAP